MPSISAREFSAGTKFFHWAVAIILIPMLAFGFFLEDLPDLMRGSAVTLHKSFGLTVLFLMLLRIFWISHTGKPAFPAVMPMWERILARMVQLSLYLAVIAMPLVGWLMSTAAQKPPVFFGLFKLPFPGIPADKAFAKNMFETHQVLAWVIIVLLILHIVGALKHHYLDKDNVLRRMLPGQ